MSSRIDHERRGQRPHRAAAERPGVDRAPAPRGSTRLDLDLQSPVALVAGSWADEGRALTRVLLRGGFRVLGAAPVGGTDTPQLVVLPADAAPAAVRELVDAHTGRSVRCRLAGSPVAPDTTPDSWVDVRVVLLATGTWAQREAAAGGLAAVLGVLVTDVLAGSSPASRSGGAR